VRVNTWDPDVIDLYRSEGVDEVLLWARSPYVDTYRNELWPLGAHADQEAGLAEIANALDLIPGPEPPRLDG
jgi:hypothetical protein